MIRCLELRKIAPISSMDMEFEDLTVFVAPQATGKSIAPRWLKLLEVTIPVREKLAAYGVHWNGDLSDMLAAYFGEGMEGAWQDGQSGSQVLVAVTDVSVFNRLRPGGQRRAAPSAFYIPAQRALAMRDG